MFKINKQSNQSKVNLIHSTTIMIEKVWKKICLALGYSFYNMRQSVANAI